GDLIAAGDKEGALDLLDGINWRKVHNVNLLLKAGDYYEQLECYENALDLLEAAHERSPIGRMIIYRLALISIGLGELDRAKDYYDEFVEIAPHDSLKYVIKYRLNEAKGADEMSLIAVLEELRSHELIEEWLFQLACLYRKVSMVDRCVEICDEIVLWFGDGPYVEKALEMKLLYQPLDKQQENKYRAFQQKKDGITEITPTENYGGGEIINRPIEIPRIEEEPEQFDTVNLQAAIKRNIEEIMQATEAGEISENMEAIKDLVEEIPYLKVNSDEKTFDEVRKEKRKEDREIGESLKSRFSEYLAEEYDGQLSIFVPSEEDRHEPPIEGQFTIEDVMNRWERTRRAAEAALLDAEQQKFEQVKAKALAEANQIMDRLNDAVPKLDAGATPAELLKEEILSGGESESAANAEKKTFKIPKVTDGEEVGVGLEIPVISAAETKDTAETAPAKTSGAGIVTEEKKQEKAKGWAPKALEENKEPEPEMAEVKEEAEPEIKPEAAETVSSEPEPEVSEEIKLKPEESEEIKPEPEESEEIKSESEGAEKIETKPEAAAEPQAIKKAEAAQKKPKATEESKPKPKAEAPVKAEPATKSEPVKAAEEANASEPVKQEEPEKDTEPTENTELPTSLTKEEKDIFSYFTPIKGMEKNLLKVLNDERQFREGSTEAGGGHIIVEGGMGSGKTTLATSIVKILQNEGMISSRAVGKIDGENLNKKNIRELFDKIRSGVLIVENAGTITRDTAVTLSLLLDSDTSGILLILEDSKMGIDRALSQNGNFAAQFTERINIPLLTIDELVNFGKVYALDLGYAVDEIAVLALYDRINIIKSFDHPVYLTEIKEIVDQAIDRAEHRKGFFGIGGKKYDEEGNLILKEKDFNEK
ncbi:MAG: hypothetical protein J6N76_10920, partial [Lachnospiraceae bacterium]|nr:hypothetical protein [Lachnospiraceae bacterium]